MVHLEQPRNWKSHQKARQATASQNSRNPTLVVSTNDDNFDAKNSRIKQCTQYVLPDSPTAPKKARCLFLSIYFLYYRRFSVPKCWTSPLKSPKTSWPKWGTPQTITFIGKPNNNSKTHFLLITLNKFIYQLKTSPLIQTHTFSITGIKQHYTHIRKRDEQKKKKSKIKPWHHEQLGTAIWVRHRRNP